MDPFNLDPASIGLLTDIFARSLRERAFVDVSSYRLEHRDQRPLLDRLAERKFILREPEQGPLYRVSLAALVAIDTDDSKIELNRCADIFRLLQRQYAATRQAPKYLSEIAIDTRLADHQVRETLTYLLDSQFLWLAGRSNELTPPDKAYVSPSESILDFDSFDDVLHQIVENHKPTSSEEIFSSFPRGTDEHIQRILVLMDNIRTGTRSFNPTTQSAPDIAAFQQIGRDLEWLHRRGYLQFFKPLREEVSGRTRFVSVAVGDLTFEGNLYLTQRRSAPEASGTGGQAEIQHADASMLVFISWSGELSHRIALTLKEWLPLVLPFIDPWVSSEDIAKGTRWTPEMASALDKSNYGIICVVSDNVREPWISFEAGAISKALGARVSPFLMGLSPKDLGNGPFSQFQCTTYDKEEVRKLLYSLNESGSSRELSRDRVDRNFDLSWLGLQEKLDALRRSAESVRQQPIDLTTQRLVDAASDETTEEKRWRKEFESWSDDERTRMANLMKNVLRNIAFPKMRPDVDSVVITIGKGLAERGPGFNLHLTAKGKFIASIMSL